MKKVLCIKNFQLNDVCKVFKKGFAYKVESIQVLSNGIQGVRLKCGAGLYTVMWQGSEYVDVDG